MKVEQLNYKEGYLKLKKDYRKIMAQNKDLI